MSTKFEWIWSTGSSRNRTRQFTRRSFVHLWWQCTKLRDFKMHCQSIKMIPREALLSSLQGSNICPYIQLVESYNNPTYKNIFDIMFLKSRSFVFCSIWWCHGVLKWNFEDFLKLNRSIDKLVEFYWDFW